MKRFPVLFALTLPLLTGGTVPAQSAPRGPVLYKQTFEGLDANLDDGQRHHGFWFEGAAGGGHAKIVDGRLQMQVNDGKAGTIWLDLVFPGDLRVEFDVHITASTGDKNNMNFFLLFADETGKPLYETRATRADGGYKNYHGGKDADHPLHGYIITHLANGTPAEPRYRLRATPPFDPVLHEVNGVLDAAVGKTYRIAVDKVGPRITYTVDGTKVFETVDDNSDGKDLPVRDGGLIGFRSWSTDLWWDNLRVIKR